MQLCQMDGECVAHRRWRMNMLDKQWNVMLSRAQSDNYCRIGDDKIASQDH
eukprot:m.203442 g.203442  ORF g.203442 m.203442 type:complete len:51 (+) comp39624_c0_seq1:1026-1178(+)